MGAGPCSRHRGRWPLSYIDPYVDYTGRVTAYALVNLADAMGDYDWRLRDDECLEGRTRAARLPASADPILGCPRGTIASVVPCISDAPWPKTGRLPRAGSAGRPCPPNSGIDTLQCPDRVIRDIIPGRGIPAGGVAPPSDIPDILGRRALPSGRRAPGLMPRSTRSGH